MGGVASVTRVVNKRKLIYESVFVEIFGCWSLLWKPANDFSHESKQQLSILTAEMLVTSFEGLGGNWRLGNPVACVVSVSQRAVAEAIPS